MYAALDLAEQKVAMQLRRFNQRLKDHHRRDGRPGGPATAAEPLGEGATYEDVIEDLRAGGGGGKVAGGARPPDVPQGGHER
jgi:hypothetical protein